MYAFLFCDMSILSEKDFSYDKKNLLLCLLGAMSICLAECGLKEKIATYVMMK